LKQNISTIVQEFLERPIADLGYELYDVEYSKKTNGMNLTIYITSPNGPITLEDCEKVHRMVDPLLDELNPTADMPYYLNVSSVGLDRPIKTDKDYKRALGQIVEIKLFTQVGDKKQYKGKLISFDESKATIEIEKGNTLDLLKKNIALCKIYIDF